MNEYCKIHDIELIEADSPVVYGLYRYSDDYLSALVSQFPNSKFVLLGGCVLDINVSFYRKIGYCPKCREAHLSWANLHDSQYGLAPGDEQHREYIERSKKKIGYPAVVPQGTFDLIANNQLSQAIKLLKANNPELGFASIRSFVMSQHSKLGAK